MYKYKIENKLFRLSDLVLALLAACFIFAPGSASAATPAITFSPEYDPPVLLRVFPVSGKARLTWLPASSTSPVSYDIYSRRFDESDFYPIGSTTLIYFNAPYTFAGMNEDAVRLYEVSAVSADGTESFLSDTVQDNDSDNDGIPDSEESIYHTSVINPDTDGDGLTDGQEVFIYHTDPLNKYSSGDGISDYDNVMADIAASTK